jgi:hypothetical protein
MRHLTRYFEQSFVINLPSRGDRRREMRRELARVGVDFAPGSIELFPAIRPADAGNFPSLGARGCFMSHLEILRRALSEGAAPVLIMEDDLSIDSRLPAIERELVERLSSLSWSLVYLGHRAEVVPTSANELLVRSDATTTCSHFYGVSSEGLPELVRYLETVLTRPAGHPEGGPMHYDGALTMFRERWPGTTLFATPSLGRQRSSRSDVAGLKWFDRLPLVREAVGQMRRLRT